MKPIGIVVNDCASAYPEHLREHIKEFYKTTDMYERLKISTGLLSDLKAHSEDFHKEIKYDDGHYDYLGDFEIRIKGNSKSWPGILKEVGVISLQHNNKFMVYRTSGSSNEHIHDIASTCTALSEARRAITSGGVENVSLCLSGMDDQLSNSPANSKAQKDFLNRLGYKTK